MHNPLPQELRVLIYSRAFAPAIGGLETYTATVAAGLARTGCRITVATQTPGEGSDESFGFAVLRQPSLRGLWRQIKTSDAVLVAGPALAPILLSIAAGRPLTISHHGYQAVCPNGLLLEATTGKVCDQAFAKKRYADCVRCGRASSGFAKAVMAVVLTGVRRALCTRAKNIAVSAHLRDRLNLGGYVIYHGIPAAAPTSVDHGKNQPVHFAYVGRLVQEKGVPLLISAAETLARENVSFHLSIVGDGPLRTQLTDDITRRGLDNRITMAGALRGDNLATALEAVDVVVMPSVWEEAAGLAALEHMAKAKTVIVSDIGGLGEVVGTAGIKFRPGDASDLADKMRQAANDRELLRQTGILAAKRVSETFGLQRMIDAHKAILLSSQASRPSHSNNR